jgi:hypothetical protein
MAVPKRRKRKTRKRKIKNAEVTEKKKNFGKNAETEFF